MKLSEASVGRSYVVVKVEGSGLTRRRLLDLGLLPGVKLRVVRLAPLGDPMEIEVRGYNLSVRKSEASQVIVEEVQ
ncbi:MAG: ferrous iron transport protein A [Thermoprotei archaeon]|nr:MAG: ferrous iron transport protein A [Thermoprotei archaeon]